MSKKNNTKDQENNTKDQVMCYHHPNRPATHKVNLGTVLDLYTPLCSQCVDSIRIASRDYNATVSYIPIRN